MKTHEKELTVSSNTVIRNEIRYVEGLIRNLLDARVDQIVLLDGGSTDGTWELIQRFAKQYPQVLPISWPQTTGSEYKSGFKEVARRNLMLDASSSERIFYIDADERVSLDFKRALSSDHDCHILERLHFWKGRVRVSTPWDAVWSLEQQIRIFANDSRFRFASNDPNGLHNFLTFRGIPVKLARTRGHGIRAALAVLYAGMRLRIAPPTSLCRLYHYHYHDLSKPKPNDLRAAEFDWPIRSANELAQGKAVERKAVYCAEPEAYAETSMIYESYCAVGLGALPQVRAEQS